jgi:outer membrane murein-binding lipoprotein Lpp
MSDMYLELKSRIPVVAARTHIGTARIQEAQDARGLSNERIARLIPVSEKTWRRWKEAGEIPTAALPAVALALGLELRGVEPEAIDVSTPSGSVDELSAKVDRLASAVEELRHEILAELQARPESRRAVQ